MEKPIKNDQISKPDEQKVGVCSHCGRPLEELLWSKSVPGQRTYILTCVNIGCPRYRNPVKTIVEEVVK